MALLEDDWSGLLAAGRSRRWPAGARILREGATDGQVLALIDGRVKITVVAPTGRELLLAVRGPGELVGEFAALDGAPRSAAVVALDPVHAAVVPRERFTALLDDHPRVALHLLRELASQLRVAGRSALDLGTGDVEVRVSRRLLDLAERFGEFNSGSVAIRLSLTQEDLAAWVGATREATNRSLRALRDRGVIATGRQRIVVVDVPGLRQCAA